MIMRKMFRYAVPVDDRPHVVKLAGSPVAVAAASLETVEFWAEHDDLATEAYRTFIVVGTGHRIPDGALWRGTCQRYGGLVWHLYEVTDIASLPEPELAGTAAA
jgi:hypothetical protein